MSIPIEILSEFDPYDYGESIPPPHDTDSFVRRHNEIVASSYYQNCPSQTNSEFKANYKQIHGESFESFVNDDDSETRRWVERVRPQLLDPKPKKKKLMVEASIEPESELMGAETVVSDAETLDSVAEAAEHERKAEQQRHLDFWVPIDWESFGATLEDDEKRQKMIFDLLSECMPTLLDPLPNPLPEVLLECVRHRQLTRPLRWSFESSGCAELKMEGEHEVNVGLVKVKEEIEEE